TAIANTLRLLNAARPVQEALLEDKISEGHARALLGLETPEAQGTALKTVLKQGLNVRQTEQLVRRLLGRQEEKHREVQPSPEVRQLERRFREALRTKVSLRRQGSGGRLVIYFYSEEELAAIYDHIVGE
ncbi:MAG: ParB/RepB/Spo0J family partition protein, partial [Anaerolineae bacterium]